MYIGIDDTDSRSGMCTTYLVSVMLEKILEDGLDLIGAPRLVRLNPNIPWKTRGNGTISIKIGKGYGPKKLIGMIKGRFVYAYKYGNPVNYDPDKIKEVVKEYFVLEEPTTNPGIVISPKKLPEKLYWRAARKVLSIEYVEKLLQEHNAKYFKFKNGRGIIGASAAIAWRARHYTYELLTYLPRGKWSGERYVDRESIIKMDKKIKSTFDNYDYVNNYLAIVPHSKTPVLYGIRGVNPDDLIMAKNMIKSETYESWLLFLTNQGSDDHIIRRKINKIEKNENVAIRGEIISNPKKIEGGHVIFKLKDSSGEIDCVAYEPTKGFRKIVEKLHTGDKVEVYGSVRDVPRSVNIEKIRVLNLADVMVKVSNPVCPKCGRIMESIGKNKGYRCRKCGFKLPESAAKYEKIERNIEERWYEVPVIARRHLAKPLKIMNVRSSKIF